MIDIHSHILPGLDEGIVDLGDALKVLKEANEAGFDKVIATTHYSKRYHDNERNRLESLELIRNKIVGMEVFLGNEIMINSQIDDLIKNKEASTINDSRYVLFELPLRDNEYPDLKNIILDLISKGYHLILAHPERYVLFQKNPEKVEDIVNMGVYLQANFLSIMGRYGKEAQKTVELLFKHNMISFLGTDVHKPLDTYFQIKDSSERIINIIGEKKFKDMTDINPQRVLDNDIVENPKYMPMKKNLFGKYR